jgi:predicted RNA methylase
MDTLDLMWSNTDFPYMCLRDEVRTLSFRKAIGNVVKKNDRVVDVGAGSGILSFFAAEAGAKIVYAVEVEHMLASALRKSARANGLQDVIEVVEGDILKVYLPTNIDVLIAEIIETGLLDELQVPALNVLRERGIISDKTRIIPSQYKTYLQLIHTSHTYYGFKILAPKHEWPFYRAKDTGWCPASFEPVSEPIEIQSIDFSMGMIDEEIRVTADFALTSHLPANAIKISGLLTLSDGVFLGPTNALNGDKILPIEPICASDIVRLVVNYRMGGGLGSFQMQRP